MQLSIVKHLNTHCTQTIGDSLIFRNQIDCLLTLFDGVHSFGRWAHVTFVSQSQWEMVRAQLLEVGILTKHAVC